nr:MAG TPA: hypothetical protein [Bacteriophage sp.]
MISNENLPIKYIISSLITSPSMGGTFKLRINYYT